MPRKPDIEATLGGRPVLRRRPIKKPPEPKRDPHAKRLWPFPDSQWRWHMAQARAMSKPAPAHGWGSNNPFRTPAMRYAKMAGHVAKAAVLAGQPISVMVNRLRKGGTALAGMLDADLRGKAKKHGAVFDYEID